MPSAGKMNPGAISRFAVGNPSSRPRSSPCPTTPLTEKLRPSSLAARDTSPSAMLLRIVVLLDHSNRVGHKVNRLESEADTLPYCGKRIESPIAVSAHSEVRADDQPAHSQLFIQMEQEFSRGQPRQFAVEPDRDDEINSEFFQKPDALVQVGQKEHLCAWPEYRDRMVLEGQHAR